MDHLGIVQDSIDYIEQHVQDDFSADMLAGRAGFSTYHYYRVFHAYTGLPLMTYVRNRRIAHAACALSQGTRLLDVALTYGFGSHAAFTRAFRRVMGTSPEQYRARVGPGSLKPPLEIDLESMRIYVKEGGIIMEPKIENWEKTHIAGYILHTTTEGGRNRKEIPQFWKDILADGRYEQMHRLPGAVPDEEYGICINTTQGSGQLDYVIGVTVDDPDRVPDAFDQMTIEPCAYAVFAVPTVDRPAEVPKAIQGTWDYIYREWLPGSGYAYANGHPDFEWYGPRDGGNHCDIYIPVIRKEEEEED